MSVNVTQSLLEDPSHVIRSLLAFGVCKICALYWEYIPTEVVKTLLTSLIQKHAWDSSNTEVRLSVIKVRCTCLLFTMQYKNLSRAQCRQLVEWEAWAVAHGRVKKQQKNNIFKVTFKMN